LVTLAIAAIVMSIAVPSFATFIQNNRKTTNINDLVIALNFARAEATTRQQRVTVCKSADGAACVTTGDWSQGWIVFADPVDPKGSVGAGDVILKITGALTGVTSFAGNANVDNSVSFKPQGMTDGLGGTITLCDSRGASHAAATIISMSGRIRMATDDNDAGNIVEDGSGDDVTCE
jgi:type IV fimbrial biogenesis protein FimT